MVVPGYWANAEATAASFTAGCWHSGDLGSVDAHGYVRVFDRKKDMLNRGGYKIYSIEVENVLMAWPGMVEAAVVGKPCPVLGERVHAFVHAPGGAHDDAALRALCAARLADYKVPETLTWTDAPLPRNANGKLMKRAAARAPADVTAPARGDRHRQGRCSNRAFAEPSAPDPIMSSYMLLMLEPPEQRRTRTRAEGEAVFARMLQFAEELKSAGRAARRGVAVRRIRRRRACRCAAAARRVVDGPFAEAKEMIGGFYLLDCDTTAQALAIAQRVPGRRVVHGGGAAARALLRRGDARVFTGPPSVESAVPSFVVRSEGRAARVRADTGARPCDS